MTIGLILDLQNFWMKITRKRKVVNTNKSFFEKTNWF